MKKLMSLADAERELGLKRDALRRQVRLGRLAATKVGNTWVVTAAEVERYRREHRGQVGRPAGS